MMTAKEYLMEIQRCKRAMETLGQKAEQLRAEMEGLKAITYDKDRVQVSPSNRMEELMPRLIEAEERYGEAIYNYHTAILVRVQQIADIGRSDYAEILTLRYVEKPKWRGRYTLNEIARRMHISFDRAAHLHGEALEAFRRKYL